MGAELYATVNAQLDALVAQLGVPGKPTRRLFQALASPPLHAFTRGGRRFSGITGDGVPFQWSVSVGLDPGGLRFVADGGLPDLPVSACVRHARSRLAKVAALWPDTAQAEMWNGLYCLLPADTVLEATGALMVLWIGSGVTPSGQVGLKIYVNQEMGDEAGSYRRFAECAALLGRRRALECLVDLVAAVGSKAVPVCAAFDASPAGIGRLKLYFRATLGTPALLAETAEASGCIGVADRLTVLHSAMLAEGTYPPHSMFFSIEFPADHQATAFKVDLSTSMFLTSDADVDNRICRLLHLAGLPGEEYHHMRDIVVGRPSADAVVQLVGAAVALRREELRVNAYFHPCADRAR